MPVQSLAQAKHSHTICLVLVKSKCQSTDRTFKCYNEVKINSTCVFGFVFFIPSVFFFVFFYLDTWKGTLQTDWNKIAGKWPGSLSTQS